MDGLELFNKNFTAAIYICKCTICKKQQSRTHLRLDIKLCKLLLIPLRRIIIAGIHPYLHLGVEPGINIRSGIETMRRHGGHGGGFGRGGGVEGLFHGGAVAVDGGDADQVVFGLVGDGLV